MSTTRRAIYLPAAGNFEIITQSAAYVPTGSQILVRVSYSAVNPGDKRHLYMGLHSYVAGYEWIGTVEATGPESPYGVGEAVFGLAKFGHRRPIEIGAHQDLVLAETGTGSYTYRVPKGSENQEQDLKSLVASPSALQTAADALFNCLGFAFPPTSNLPDQAKIDGADPKGRAILIWGGSSAVGLAAIYVAKQAGFGSIYTTASLKNHATLLALGATQCFDYRSPTVVDDIRSAVACSPNRKLSIVFDAVTTGTGFGEPATQDKLDLSKSSPALANRCLTDGPDAKDTYLCASLPLPSDPRWSFCLAIRNPKESPQIAEYNRKIEAFMAWALADFSAKGGYRLPKITVVKGAEEGIQAINDVFEGKYSMEKLVIQHPL
ncbi:hypothetical protein F5Y19DRAFT_177139 [Xylariaceae sp. FL1651]|nr:hypothetical protein F5Y19DRAFT_177139 [Xylariaceae sp. FL1651]